MHPAAAAACSPPLACTVVLCSTLAVTGARLLALQGKNGEEEVAVLSWSRPGRGRRDDDDAGHWRQRADDVEMADAKIGRSECASFGETGELDALPCPLPGLRAHISNIFPQQQHCIYTTKPTRRVFKSCSRP
jgi:hypothetical protein